MITLQKNRPFTFLDHALRCGDSLLGVTRREQIEFLHLNPDNEAVQLRTVSEIWRPLLAQAIAKRKELESFTVNDIHDLARKEVLQAEAEGLTSNIKIAADYLIGEALAQAGKTVNFKVEDLGVLSEMVTDALAGAEMERREDKLRQIREMAQRMLNMGNPEGQPPRQPFHWALEFPEVFLEEDASKGFSATVGNPPFMKGSYITGTIGLGYREQLVEQIADQKRGNADLCAYFLLRSLQIIKIGGLSGLITTNTISQGDTREVGLDQIIKLEFTVSRANANLKWPGAASVEITCLWIYKGEYEGEVYLDEKKATTITSYLRPKSTNETRISSTPHRLASNFEKSFTGSYPMGKGFVINPQEVQFLLKKNPSNRDVLFPYLTGQDLNSRADMSPSRWVINFHDWSFERSSEYPDCLQILTDRVKEYRESATKPGKQVHESDYWKFWDKRLESYKAIEGMERVLFHGYVSKYLCFGFVPTNIIYASPNVVIGFSGYKHFASLQSFAHEVWVLSLYSTMRTDIRYAPSDVFETFPFPDFTDTLENIGETYYTHRQTIMQTRQEGLTKTYNRFHDPTCTDPDIQTLRDLHIQMDTAAAATYGWSDLDLGHDFHTTKQGLRFTISEGSRREVLDRLLALNHQRYAAEVAEGLHDKKGSKGKSKKAKSKPASVTNTASKSTTQGSLFGDDPTPPGELF